MAPEVAGRVTEVGPSLTPYRELSTELVAAALALFEQVGRSTFGFRESTGHVYVALDTLSRSVWVCLRGADGELHLLEQIRADPSDPNSFGAPIAQMPSAAACGHLH